MECTNTSPIQCSCLCGFSAAVNGLGVCSEHLSAFTFILSETQVAGTSSLEDWHSENQVSEQNCLTTTITGLICFDSTEIWLRLLAAHTGPLQAAALVWPLLHALGWHKTENCVANTVGKLFQFLHRIKCCAAPPLPFHAWPCHYVQQGWEDSGTLLGALLLGSGAPSAISCHLTPPSPVASSLAGTSIFVSAL